MNLHDFYSKVHVCVCKIMTIFPQLMEDNLTLYDKTCHYSVLIVLTTDGCA